MQNVIAIIPARLESSRLPKKLLEDLGGKPLLVRVYENLEKMNLFAKIIVASDSVQIIELCKQSKIECIKTSTKHKSGTSRIIEAYRLLTEGDIIVNVQGDEPFIERSDLHLLITKLQHSDALIASLFVENKNEHESNDPNNVKVILDKDSNALFFSRYAIPYDRDNTNKRTWCHHLGVYAFKPDFLNEFHNLISCPYEGREKLEQLSFLFNGYKISMIQASKPTLGIDTKDNLEEARKIFDQKKKAE